MLTRLGRMRYRPFDATVSGGAGHQRHTLNFERAAREHTGRWGLRVALSLALAVLAAVACVCAAGGVSAPDDLLRQLRFSPDGRYVLAQDDSEITVLTVQPFAILFRIPAENAIDAQFTPDSQQVVFVSSVTRASPQSIAYRSSTPHAERWSIAGKTRVGYREIPMAPCGTEAMSPDGLVVACDDFEGTLRLIDVNTAATIFEKQQFVKLIPMYNYLRRGVIDLPNGQYLGNLGEAIISYSPDGRFVIVCPSGGQGKQVGYDLRERCAVALRGHLRRLFNLAFVAPERLLFPWSVAPSKGVSRALLVAFPSGRVLSKPEIPTGFVHSAADPGFVLIRPFGKNTDPDQVATRVAAAELSTGQVIISNTLLMDVCGRYYVAGPSGGEAGLYERGKGLQATVVLHRK